MNNSKSIGKTIGSLALGALAGVAVGVFLLLEKELKPEIKFQVAQKKSLKN